MSNYFRLEEFSNIYYSIYFIRYFLTLGLGISIQINEIDKKDPKRNILSSTRFFESIEFEKFLLLSSTLGKRNILSMYFQGNEVTKMKYHRYNGSIITNRQSTQSNLLHSFHTLLWLFCSHSLGPLRLYFFFL